MTSGGAPLIVDGFRRVRRSTFTEGAIMERAEYNRPRERGWQKRQKGRRDMQRRTRRSTSTIGGAAPDTIIGRADADRAGARPRHALRKTRRNVPLHQGFFAEMQSIHAHSGSNPRRAPARSDIARPRKAEHLVKLNGKEPQLRERKSAFAEAGKKKRRDVQRRTRGSASACALT